MKIALFALCALAASAACAQTWPDRPIRFVTAAAGGGNDVTARILAQGLTERLGQQVIVDNRGGAHVPPNTVANAAPDGYTILVQNNTVWDRAVAREDRIRSLLRACATDVDG